MSFRRSSTREERRKIYCSAVYVQLGGTSRTSEPQDGLRPVEFHLDLKKSLTKPETPPEFIVKPRRQFLDEGQTAKFKCSFEGPPSTEVSWLKDGKLLEQNEKYKMYEDDGYHFLEIVNVTGQVGGTYTCKLQNSAGTATATTDLEIYEKPKLKTKLSPPAIEVPLTDKMVTAGSRKVKLTCEASNAENAKVTWYKDGKQIRPGRIYQINFNGKMAEFIISEGQPEDSGVYECVFKNDVGEARTNATLRVHAETRDPREPPVFTKELQDMEVNDGDKVELVVEVKGTPPIALVWVHNNEEIMYDDPVFEQKSFGNMHKLIVHEAYPEDGGEYVCEAYNDFGDTDTFCRVHVREKNVIIPPEFVTKLQPSTVTTGSCAIFTCHIKGDPQPSVSWKKGRDIIQENKKYRISRLETEHSLEIVDVNLTDRGRYTCVISNPAGSVQCTASLLISEEQRASQRSASRQRSSQNQSTSAINVMNSNRTVNGSSVPNQQPILNKSFPSTNSSVAFSPRRDNSEEVDFRSVLKNKVDRFKIDTVDKQKSYKAEQVDFRNVLKQKKCDQHQKRGSIDSGVSDMSDRDAKQDREAKQEQRNTAIKQSSSNHNPSSLPQIDRLERMETLHRHSEPFINVQYKETQPNDKCSVLDKKRAMSLEPDIKTLSQKNYIFHPEDLNLVNHKQLVFANDNLHPENPPKILSFEPTHLSVAIGQTVRITSKYSGEPLPTVRWLKHHEDVKCTGRISVKTTNTQSTLTIRRIHPSEAGVYTFLLENKFGAESETTSVTVEEPPSSPVGKPYATEIGSTELILTWCGPAYDGSSPILNYRLEICELNKSKWRILTANCKNTTYRVTNLQENTDYKFRVSSENKHGISEPGTESDVIHSSSNITQSSMLDSDSDGSVYTLSHYSDTLSPPSVFSEAEELPFEPRPVGIFKDRKFEDNYDILEEVGRGKFGSVFKCREKLNNQTWAAKVIKCREKDKAGIYQEIEIMNCLAHPKVLMLWEAYETPRSMVLVMEFVGGGELFERVISDSFVLTERDCINFVRQICEGVCYIHHRNIIHLDLKPENIVCVAHDSNKIKIIDFGLARKYRHYETTKCMFGTPEFVAPEVVNYEEINFSTDMWSVGVICYVLLSGLSPFMGDSDQETFSNVTRAEFDFDDDAFDEISEVAKDFIYKLLLKNKNKRMTVQECLRHLWLAQDINKVRSKRLNTEKLKRFMARRKWQKTGTAIRALGRMASLQRLSAMLKRQSTSTSSRSSSESSLHADLDTSVFSQINSPSSILKVQEESPVTENIPDFHHISEQENINGYNMKFSEDSQMFKSASYDSGISSESSHNVSLDSQSLENIRTVPKPPVFLKEMRDSEAFTGDAIRFDVKVSGDPEPQVVWYFEGDTVLEDERHFIDSSDNGQCSLIIRNVTEEDEGEYMCSAMNGSGETSCSADLFICGTF